MSSTSRSECIELKTLTENKSINAAGSNDEEEKGELRKTEAVGSGKVKRILTVVLLWMVIVLVSAAFSLIGSFFPIEAKEQGSNALTTSFIIAGSPLALTIFCPLVGYYLPKMGTKLTIISGEILVGGVYILMGSLAYMPSTETFVVYGILMRLVEGVGWAMAKTTAFAILPTLFPSNLGVLSGILLGGIGLGYAAGPVVGTLLVVAIDYSTPFWVVGGLNLLLVPFTMLLVEEISATSLIVSLPMAIKLHSHLSFTMILIAVMCGYWSLILQVTSLSLYLNQLGWGLLRIGAAFAALSLSYLLGTFVAGQLADTFGPRSFITAGLFVDGATLIVVGFHTSIPILVEWTIFILLCLIGFTAAMADAPALSDLLNQANKLYPDEDREAVSCVVSGLTTFSQSFGSLSGSFLAGLLTYYMDYRSTSLLIGETLIMHGFLVLGVSLIDYKLK